MTCGPSNDQSNFICRERLREEHQRVHAAIAQLGDKERLAVHIFYLCEEPAEVARQALGLSASGFYKIIENARSRLKAILTQQDCHSGLGLGSFGVQNSGHAVWSGRPAFSTGAGE